MSAVATRGSVLALAIVAAFAVAPLGLAQVAPKTAGTQSLAPLELDVAVSDESSVHGIPGARPGTERWIVHFASRSFDLDAFRAAILARRPAAEVNAIVADLERAVVVDQAGFVAELERLGGRIVAQWWLIDAAAVDVERKQIDALRRLPNVASVEPDRLVELAIRTATNANNHNADALQALGHRGLGATVGIMDTGQDSNMNGTGRPHRVYYVNGDPNNQTGGGLGGSRLLINRQIGALNADDQNGHGTGVASISGGANWGTGGADDGHAPLAGIAGYAIANQVSGGASSSTTMASAWQSMAADRAQYGIVAANLSYGGSPSPTNSAQRALDSAALNADIMVCVAAGNSGPAAGSTSGSQGAANGLAVAALHPTSFVVADFSSRGPLSGDTTRFYPDIGACGVDTVMAARNDETGDFTASGTSMASPQVAGAATQLRGRFPALTALETKAILLSSTYDVSASNPGLDRNAFGMGALKNDSAHTVAAAGRFGTRALTTAAPLQTFTVPVVAGRNYGIAIAWYRISLTTTGWSNVDLQVRNASGATVATSATPRNLYEMVRFDATATETLTVRISLTSISGTTSQDVAFAWFEGPPRGRLEPFGAGCTGSGPIAPLCAAFNGAGGSLTNQTSAQEFAYDLTTTTPLTIAGFEIFSASNTGSPVTVSAALYGVTGIEPTTTPLATTTVTIGTTPGFWRGTFAAPVSIPLGRFWIGVDHGATTTWISQLNSGTANGAYSRPTFSSGTWARSSLVTRSSVRAICALAPAIPSFLGTGTPTIGRAFELVVSRASPGTAGVLAYGFSNSVFAGGPLPFPLAAFGAPGCSLLTSTDVTTVIFTNQMGEWRSVLSVPLDPALGGAEFFGQVLIADRDANALGFVTSNGLRIVVGG